MANELNHHNLEYVTWKYEELNFALLGGIRIEGLHSMRVTLTVDFKTFPSIRHGLDLYNESQTKKLIKNIAERFTLSTTYIHKAIGNLINTVEDYRLQQIDSNKLKSINNKPSLTKEEITAAENYLKQSNLLQNTNDDIGMSGVIGEETNRLIMYLAFTSRKTNRPLHIISFGSSGVGKSHLQEKVGELIPEEDKIEITSVTGNAFYYYDTDELGHKLILIEDYDGVLTALYPIRELQSKQKIRKTITVRDKNGNTKTLHLTVKGPVSIGGCTTSEHIYEDNANRSFLIYLDETEAQDERLMDYQRKLSAGKINVTEQHKIQKLLQNVQRVLQPIRVKNPFAKKLIIPKEVFKPRRTNAHYIDSRYTMSMYISSNLYIPGSDMDHKGNVSKIYKNMAEFTLVNKRDVQPRDVAIFEGDNGISHSATVVQVGKRGRRVKLDSKDDTNPVQRDLTIKQIQKGNKRDFKRFTGYYRHNENKRVNIAVNPHEDPGNAGAPDGELIKKVIEDAKKTN